MQLPGNYIRLRYAPHVLVHSQYQNGELIYAELHRAGCQNASDTHEEKIMRQHKESKVH